MIAIVSHQHFCLSSSRFFCQQFVMLIFCGRIQSSGVFIIRNVVRIFFSPKLNWQILIYIRCMRTIFQKAERHFYFANWKMRTKYINPHIYFCTSKFVFVFRLDPFRVIVCNAICAGIELNGCENRAEALIIWIQLRGLPFFV